MKDIHQEDVLELVHGVMHAHRSLQYRFLRNGPHDITHMDARVLAFFSRHPGATQRDLVEHTGRDKAQLGRLIKGLRKRDLLRTEADLNDRRSVRLSLTTAGQMLQQVLSQRAKVLSKRSVSGLNSIERRTLIALLRRVKENLEATE